MKLKCVVTQSRSLSSRVLPARSDLPRQLGVTVRRAHRRPEKLLPASRWQNPPARCRRHSGGPGAARGLACFDLIRSVAGFARVALTGLCLAARAATPEPFELKDGDRVLFIGDTFFEREVDYGHIETRLT